jgi:hypothetical protein
VVVTAAGHDQAVLPRDRCHGVDGRLVERAVVDLQALQPGIDQLADEVRPAGGLAKMGEHG